MEIRKEDQYNQGIGKYKVLYSNAGVGSIVATKWGGFIMPMSSSKWDAVSNITTYLQNHYEALDWDGVSVERGVELLEDKRFIKFLCQTEGMTHLRCFVAVPHVSLSPYNTCNVKDLPLNVRHRNNTGQDIDPKLVTIPAIPFPRWFFSKRSHKLKHYDEWLRLWREKECNNGEEKYFAPPRDPEYTTNRLLPETEIPRARDRNVHELLEQVTMVLVCPRGHISDIPWDKYFSASINVPERVKETGFDLFGYNGALPCPNGRRPDLQWLENRSNVESFGRLKCKHYGDDGEGCQCCRGSVSLEGIMNIQPLCPGERPWEGPGEREPGPCMKEDSHERSTMKWALVTSNSVYYAESFSSLYIPDVYGGLPTQLQRLLDLMTETWFGRTYIRRHPDGTREDYINSVSIEDLLDKAQENPEFENISLAELQRVVDAFLGANADEEHDVREAYRYKEFSVFNEKPRSIESENKSLCFSDIELPESLSPYFKKIQQVETMGVTSTQLNFSRVSMPQSRMVNGSIEYPSCMKIFKGNPDEVLAIPAVQTFGEGIFFSFNEEKIKDWIQDNRDELDRRYEGDATHEPLYESLYRKMESGGYAKFYLLHTFSHILLKELEFSCGYPTASLKERLYFSQRMCGVLIYTADGAEGSMGGLVWQGQPKLIEKIIMSALERARNCSSDPVCWENDEKPNFAACFACTMVSETSCEERNLGLDRRVLVDEAFGFFSNIHNP